MQYIEVTVSSTTMASELVADVFWELDGQGVCILDKADVLDLIKNNNLWDYIDDELTKDDGGVVYIKGFFKKDEMSVKMNEFLARLETLKKNADGVINFGSLEITNREIKEEDWINVWKKHYKPIKIKDVVICPKWIKYEGNETIVKIDPGMAFGTGEHETTSMCIDLVQDFEVKEKTVFDIGCGSGILGITAKKLGAKNVLMADIDSVAVTASKFNAELNGVIDEVEIYNSDLLQMVKGKADIVFANITADILIRLSKDIKKVLNDNGKIILSGIIHKRKDDVLNAYLDAGFKLIKHIQKGEWNALSLEV